tara:strand:+ start:1176 stop:1538 length:363 start_codon:yes stop_codon:yes gene_type:complete
MPLCYLQIRGESTLEVCPELRDWNDYDVRLHLEYHVAMIECMGDRFSVIVDASKTPLAAYAHIGFFAELFNLLRTSFKGRLRTCTITNPPGVVTAVHRTLAAFGLIGTDTMRKIIFVNTD